jgi:outer membrane protein TolC
LQLGYRSADEDARAAILGQFPAFTLGGSWNSDNTGIRSAGPTATFDLPLFSRNQGQIATSQATRRLLHEQYQARLDSAIAGIKGLIAQEAQLRATLAAARAAAASAESLAGSARSAYAQANLDQRAWTDYETTALQRQLEVIALERSLGEVEIALTVELGMGLPRTRIVPPDTSEGA